MSRFTSDNTDGYSQSDLDALNAAYVSVCHLGDLPTASVELDTGSLLDHIAETLLSSYDAGLRGDALVTAACQGTL